MKLMAERKKKHLTQRQMAEKLDIPYSSYCEYENGKKTIPEDIAKRIAEILGKSVSVLFAPVRFNVK